MFYDHRGANSAARRKCRFNLHPARLSDRDKVIQNQVGDPLVERTMVSILLQVQFERFQFVADFVGDVRDRQRPKVRLASFRAYARELGANVADQIVAMGSRILEALKDGHTQIVP